MVVIINDGILFLITPAVYFLLYRAMTVKLRSEHAVLVTCGLKRGLDPRDNRRSSRV
jgi:hypothetical protein